MALHGRAAAAGGRSKRPAYGTEVWSSAGWRRDAVSWLDDQLAAAGLVRTGEVTQPRLRPWGTVLQALTNRGTVWLKAPGQHTVFEVELYQLLRRVTPVWVLPPLGVDLDRGWVLLPDGGQILGDCLDDLDLVEVFEVILQQYGQFQRTLMPYVGDLLACGVTDMRPATMPVRFDQALAVATRYVAKHGDSTDRELLDRAAATRDRFVRWCDRLAGAIVTASLDHNDLHPWNVFADEQVTARRANPVKFYDWGDSVVAHPFSSMLLGLGFISQHLGVGPDDPAVVRPRDAYLEVFSDLATHAELVDELETACWIGKAARVLTWERALHEPDGESVERFARAPFRWFASLATDSWISAD